MSSSDNLSKSESLQIIRVTKEEKDGEIVHGLELIERNLKKIMLHPKVKDNPVVIVSIAGASRKGKSFLLGFFLKYLESEDGNWLNENDRIEGFEWRNGTDLITSGIHMWSKPFIRKNRHGKEIAILLMDTQGVFDRRSTAQDCTSIFALSNLISSVQIYNLMHHLQEDDLQHLEFFANFGKLATENTENGDVNKTRLVFLIRDWGCPDKYPYGKIGGEDYIRNQLQMEPNEHKELQRIRQNLENCFPNISGFLLPYPGKAVATKETFDGHLNEIDEDFVVYVKELVPCILSEESLVAKKINYMEVSGNILMKYIEDLVEFLKNGEYPSTKTLFEITAEFGRQTAVSEAFNFYKEEMKKFCDEQSISEKDMDDHHKRIKKQAVEKIKALLKLRVSANELKCLEQLDSQIEEEYNWYKKMLREKNKGILPSSYTGTLLALGALLTAVFLKK